MPTNESQSTQDDLERKLDDIKAVLGIQTTTTSSVLDDIKHKLDELAEIEKLLKRAQRRADVQWLYIIGLTFVMGALALVAIKASSWAVLVTLFGGFLIMILSPYIKKEP